MNSPNFGAHIISCAPVHVSVADCHTPYVANLLLSGLRVETLRGSAKRETVNADLYRPFRVSPNVGITTWHDSAALACARLATL